ncbi:MAG: discoidin domain-containing protein [Dokdonella sp.]|uniref:discoidin domain-containing protein n=1 Tax=Dokdonella sp. TaxID=2291710 RepID=UPI003265127B
MQLRGWLVWVAVFNCVNVFASTTVAEPFADSGAWTAVGSDQVTATLRSDTSAAAPAMCLAFDFNGVSGYASMRRSLPFDVPPNYAFSFRTRGNAPPNALQFKLADASGDNVWWVNREDFVFAREWTDVRYKKRQVDFAWGPAKDKTLRHSETVEFTVYAREGGRGEVCFDQLKLTSLPEPPTTLPIPLATASSSVRGFEAGHALDGDMKTLWRGDPVRGPDQTLTVDLRTVREFGGLLLRWDREAFASRYDIELSSDAHTWRLVRRVTEGNGGVDPLDLPDSEARYVRIHLHDGPMHAYALAELEIKDLAFGASANAFFSSLSALSPRGYYPRGFYNEQTYWTVVGVDGGHTSGLLSEDGALEVARGGFSIEPFVLDPESANGGAVRVTTWADARISHALQDGYLPIPTVSWNTDRVGLEVTAFGVGEPGHSQILARYAVHNPSNAPRELVLALAVRPFQVNPSIQFLNAPGGVSPIHDLAWDGKVVGIDGTPRVFALVAPDQFASSSVDAGMIVDQLGAVIAKPVPTDAHATHALHDANGLASGALIYRLQIPANGTRTVGLSIPLEGGMPALKQLDDDAREWFLARQGETAQAWRSALDEVTIDLPSAGRQLVDTLRTALADILISRDGPALRPGTRSYARSWIRDGAMMSEALLRLGREDVARAYLDWYAPYQFKSGKVPCCVDARGSDPVPENDSHGELIQLANEVYRYTGDRTQLASMWPHVDAAARYMDTLRASEQTDANRAPGRESFFGLMPASISHEGYSAKPMHSYWDDFWALAGYKAAVEIANALGKTTDAMRLTQSRDQFKGDLYTSINRSVADHRIDYLPGCAELGDFDATSTTIALSPAGEQANLPQDLLRNTYERYWDHFVTRRDGGEWKDYTPYEWRTVGTFVRLGMRDRAHAAIDFFMHDRRPDAWNQWAEVVGRDPREARFVGDMPHGWVASDFIRSTLDLFAYERTVDQSLVLAAGVPDTWMEGPGVSIRNLHTPWGKLSYSLKNTKGVVRLNIASEGMRVPPGGFALWLPRNDGPRSGRLDGRRVTEQNGEWKITRLPAELVIR